MSSYPETFDTTGPASLDDSYAYLNWTAVSVGRILAEQPETSWELLPGLLGEHWGDPDWYQRNEWLADFYNTVYQYANSVPPAQFFVLDELGEPAAEIARVIDSVVQSWSTVAYHAPEGDEQPYDDHGDDPAYDDHGQHDQGQWTSDQQWTGQDPAYGYDDQGRWTGDQQWTGQEHPGHDRTAGEYADPVEDDRATECDPVAVTGTTPADDDLAEREPLGHVDPDTARQVLAKVLDDEADDLSSEDEQILATVLTVERFRYLAREFDLV
ncbi:hypothetical protein [Micromonospora sp. NPDC023956]|uniref:hypothetical protein n=1 Tax=Micromonospora sp. NPDC023956 TaxID=3155722 RepID=UPI00340D9F6C